MCCPPCTFQERPRFSSLPVGGSCIPGRFGPRKGGCRGCCCYLVVEALGQDQSHSMRNLMEGSSPLTCMSCRSRTPCCRGRKPEEEAWTDMTVMLAIVPLTLGGVVVMRSLPSGPILQFVPSRATVLHTLFGGTTLIYFLGGQAAPQPREDGPEAASTVSSLLRLTGEGQDRSTALCFLRNFLL